MSFAYNIKDQGALHFLTFTVHQWADVFTRQQCVDLYLDSLQYCQQEKGLLTRSTIYDHFKKETLSEKVLLRYARVLKSADIYAISGLSQ